MQSKLLRTGCSGPIPFASLFLIPLAMVYDISPIYLFQNGKKTGLEGTSGVTKDDLPSAVGMIS